MIYPRPTPIEQVSLQFLLGPNLHYKYDSRYIILPICTDANNCNMNKIFQNNSINIWLTIYFTKFITLLLLWLAIIKVIMQKQHREVSAVEQYTNDCEYLAYLKFITRSYRFLRGFLTFILCKFLVRTLQYLRENSKKNLPLKT